MLNLTVDEAAFAKACLMSDVFAAVEERALTPVSDRVVWDDLFDDWMPPFRESRIIGQINHCVTDAKYIVSGNRNNVLQNARRCAEELHGSISAVIPIQPWSLEFLLKTQTGYHDAQIFSVDALEELSGILATERMYQVRISLQRTMFKNKKDTATPIMSVGEAAKKLSCSDGEVLDMISACVLEAYYFRDHYFLPETTHFGRVLVTGSSVSLVNGYA